MPLIIRQEDRAEIARLRALAAAEPFDVRTLIADAKSDIDALREKMKAFSVLLPIGFAVAYTQEIQPGAPPPGLCHHISISVSTSHKLPSPEAVEVILEEFGMAPLSRAQGVWIEDISPGEKAINVLQLIVA